MKHIKTFFHSPLALLSLLLGLGVVMTGAHSKDVVAYAFDLPHGSAVAMETIKKTEGAGGYQPNAKVTAELHNHIEKQAFSSMVKNISDDTTRHGIRHLKKARKLPKHKAYREPQTQSFPHLFQRAFGLV